MAPKVELFPNTKSDQSFERVVQLMMGALDFTYGQKKLARRYFCKLLPFQLDVVFVPDDMRDLDIESRLKANNLKFSCERFERAVVSRGARLFNKLHGKFKNEHGAFDDYDNHRAYLLEKRLVILVVGDKVIDECGYDGMMMYMYEPPAFARHISTDSTMESCILNSKLFLIPGLSIVDTEKSVEIHNTRTESLDVKIVTTFWGRTITKSTLIWCEQLTRLVEGYYDFMPENEPMHCPNASLLTLSLHLKHWFMTKIYLHHNGQCMRLMPEDIPTVLPLLLNMENKDNWKYFEREREVNENIEHMNERCIDVEFEKCWSFNQWRNDANDHFDEGPFTDSEGYLLPSEYE